MHSHPSPYKIATLVFLENHKKEQLLLHRHQSPNKGLWSPIGGKLDFTSGESPVACAIRETKEEANIDITPADLHLFAYLAEANDKGHGHWLIFLFHCTRLLPTLPTPIKEGTFGFHSLQSIPDLPIPASDRDILWPTFIKNRNGFTGIRIHYNHANDFVATIEQEILIP